MAWLSGTSFGRDVVPDVCSSSAMSSASASRRGAGAPIASPSSLNVPAGSVAQRDEPEHADAEPLGDGNRRAGFVLGDEDRLGADVGEVEIELVGAVGRD